MTGKLYTWMTRGLLSGIQMIQRFVLSWSVSVYNRCNLSNEFLNTWIYDKLQCIVIGTFSSSNYICHTGLPHSATIHCRLYHKLLGKNTTIPMILAGPWYEKNTTLQARHLMKYARLQWSSFDGKPSASRPICLRRKGLWRQRLNAWPLKFPECFFDHIGLTVTLTSAILTSKSNHFVSISSCI